MKNVVKLFTFVITVLCLSTITGCADFPDEYAVELYFTDMTIKDDAVLSQDGKSYKATVLLGVDIKANTLNDISSAIVTIDGVSHDVKGQINPSKGGTIGVPCTLEPKKSISVSASVKIADHEFKTSETLNPYNLGDLVKIATGRAEDITPCSASLCVDADYPWLLNSNEFHVLVKNEDFNVPLNASLDKFDGQVINCTYDGNKQKLIGHVSRLAANSIYYYKVVRMTSSIAGIQFVGETKSFKTEEATAKITASVSDIDVTSATAKITFEPGNLKGLYSTPYDYMTRTGGVIVEHKGKSLEELEKSGGSFRGDGMYLSSYLTSLEPGTTYYYRYDFEINGALMCSTGPLSFTTPASTASVTLSKYIIYDTSAYLKISINKGNTANYFSKNGAYLILYYGESENNLNSQTHIVFYRDDPTDITPRLTDLRKNTKYYCKAVYYSSYKGSVLAESKVIEFTTNN